MVTTKSFVLRELRYTGSSHSKRETRRSPETLLRILGGGGKSPFKEFL